MGDFDGVGVCERYPAPINTASYNALLKEYLNGAGSGRDFQAHNFEKYASDLQIYCPKGVPYACYDLGYLYWFGIGVVKDQVRAEKQYFRFVDRFDKEKGEDIIKKLTIKQSIFWNILTKWKIVMMKKF